MTDVPVTPEFLGDVVSYVEKASAVFDANGRQAVDTEAQAKVTLDTLKKQGLCPAGADDEKLLEKLCNPVEALKALDKTARQVPPPSLGTPEGGEVKVASDQSTSVRESDARFESAMGL